MSTVREAAVSGTFYPADPVELRETVAKLLEQAGGREPESRATPAGAPAAAPANTTAPSPRALIAPHAGYVYSGPIAASAFGRLAPAAGEIERVVLIGPSHFVPFAGLALPVADAFAGPLGELPVDRAACDALLGLPQIRRAHEPHAREHCLEVELPFLQHLLGEFEIVPLVTGRATPEQVAQAIEVAAAAPAAAHGSSATTAVPQTTIVISSDLSHFHDYETARRLDERTAASITARRPGELGADSACGRLAIQGLLQVADRRGWRVSLLDLRNSGDTGGPRTEVVGYGAFAAA